MKRAIAATIWCVLSGLAAAQTAAPIKIAGSFDLSGAAASVGRDALVGVQYAIDVLNEKGGVLGRPVSLDYQDNGTNPQRAATQATALLRDGAVMLIAPQSSANTLAVSKTVSAKLKVPSRGHRRRPAGACVLSGQLGSAVERLRHPLQGEVRERAVRLDHPRL